MMRTFLSRGSMIKSGAREVIMVDR